MNNLNNKPNRAAIPHDMPISYFPGIEEAVEAWEKSLGCEPNTLREVGERAIRTRHHEAVIANREPRFPKNAPDVFEISLGTSSVYYTVEQEAVVIRGYGYEIDREPLDDQDGGYYYEDGDWYTDAEKADIFAQLRGYYEE